MTQIPDPSEERGARRLRAVEGVEARPPAPRPPEQHPPHNLPLALSTFIGREREVAEVKRLIGGTRLITLTGVGGSGKTRLGLAVAHEVVEGFKEGAWWVGLAPLFDLDLVPQAVASALGVREAPGRTHTEALVEDLKGKDRLLILDNCEHLIDACAELSDALLCACPHLKVLATSREVLSVSGEVSWPVPSLSLPNPEHFPPIEELRSYEAVDLFVERAKSALSSFGLTEANAAAVARLCLRLEGIPLAIELAAVRTKVLSVEQILDRLEDSLKLLAGKDRTVPTRQRTLRGTLNWSFELLDEQERELFERLSVFAGGWTLEAAEAVSVGDGIEQGDVLDLLSQLVDKSLVMAEAGTEGTLRYRMLEPVRQYARERLGDGEKAGRVFRRHADFFLAFAERGGAELGGPGQLLWLGRLTGEQGNLRAATAWLLGKGELEEVVRLGWALWTFWLIHGRFTEGRRWVEQALEGDDAMPASVRATALFVAGSMASGQLDLVAAESMLGESVRLYRELEDKRGIAYAVGGAGLVAFNQGRLQRAVAMFEESADLSIGEGDRRAAAWMLCYSAVVWSREGDSARAQQLAERGLTLVREVDDGLGIAAALYILGGLAQASSDHERAADLFEEGLNLSIQIGEKTNVAYYLTGLAALAGADDEVERAARLWGAAEALLEEIEVMPYPYAPEPSVHEEQVNSARSRLSEAAWEAAWSEGRAMTPEEAIGYALQTDQPSPSSKETAGLSERELEVLRLVAQGLTDSQVADSLYLSPRTVGQHLRSIYRKLGVPTRAAAVRVAVERFLI